MYSKERTDLIPMQFEDVITIADLDYRDSQAICSINGALNKYAYVPNGIATDIMKKRFELDDRMQINLINSQTYVALHLVEMMEYYNADRN